LSPLVWIVAAALVGLGLVVFLVLRDGGGGTGILDGEDDTIPAFDFQVVKTVPISVTAADAKRLAGIAEAVAGPVTDTMTLLYTEAFLDPANWRDGSYEEVWPLFDGGSQAAAQQEGDTLTLGTTAGDRFEKVDLPKGKLTVKVLLDEADEPATAVAIVTFQAVATGSDGTDTLIVSTGQYFLIETSEGWLVYSFSVSRDDQTNVSEPSPSTIPVAT